MTSHALKIAGRTAIVLGTCMLAVFLVGVRGTKAEGRHDRDRGHDHFRPSAASVVINCTLANPYTQPYTCLGNLVGRSTLTDTLHYNNGPVDLGSDGLGNVLLVSSKDTLTAQDGSTLNFSTHGTLSVEGPGYAVRNNAYLIEGGTGRFAGAVGVGTFTVSSENPLISSIHIDGTISVPRH